jgi:hypothetical protein
MTDVPNCTKSQIQRIKGHIDNLWSAFVEHLATDFTHPEEWTYFQNV